MDNVGDVAMQDDALIGEIVPSSQQHCESTHLNRCQSCFLAEKILLMMGFNMFRGVLACLGFVWKSAVDASME